ncbi:type II toxin-antitoxin system HigA family antitoxin [Pandoraea sp. NPDC087047]|uniref:helix-turn-helix domain-containing protein n=1 Tax=Pandoraea sp. NPDC087047 TaxID=3364390 RepID=UPI0037F1ABB3
MDIRPIHTEQDYAIALKTIAALVDADPAPDTPDGDRLEILSALVENYEAKHFPMELPDPVEAIKFRMEQGELSVQDMGAYIGGANRVYEVLNGTRGLSLNMIRRLHYGLRIPAEVLLGKPC